MAKLKTLHIIPNINAKMGGTAYAVINILMLENNIGIKSTVLTIKADELDPNLLELATVKILPPSFPARFSRSKNANKWLSKNAPDYDLAMIHTIWGAIHTIVAAFKSNPQKDVLSGNVFIVDRDGKVLRRFYSRKFTPLRAVYSAATLAQQGTFFRSGCFQKAGGFNKTNRVAWDGELWIDMALVGAQFGRIGEFLGAFRIYPESVSLSKHSSTKYNDYKSAIFKKVRKKNYRASDQIFRFAFKFLEYFENPKLLIERLRHSRSLKLGLRY